MAARWLGPTFLVLAACAADDTSPDDPTANVDASDTTFVDDGADANAVETDAQLLVSSLVSSIESQTFGEGARAIYLPRTCVTTTNDAASSTATYVFERCLGPNGLRAVSGTLVAKYVIHSGSVALDVTGTNVGVNKATGIAFTATAKIDANKSDRSMAWKASITGNTAGGRAFARTDEFTVTWQLGDACFGLDGKSEGQVKNRDLEVEVEGYQRCKFGCPEAGGKISVKNVAKNKTVAITYDGTNRATFTNASGKDSTIQLLCVP